MYEGDYWISADRQTDDFGSYYYITIEEVYPSEYKTSDDIHNFEVLKRLSTLYRNGVLVTFNGMRNFVKECVPFSYERVLERLVQVGFFRCKVEIPSCLLDE